MTLSRTIPALAAVIGLGLATSIFAATDQPPGSSSATSGSPGMTTQTAPGRPGMGGPGGKGMGAMGGMGDMSGMNEQMRDQMQAMQQMHEKMMAAKSPEERRALMAQNQQLMQNGMSMMKEMGPGAMQGKPNDLGARQRMMEQRMDMMQSMMQMMMDRMPSAQEQK